MPLWIFDCFPLYFVQFLYFRSERFWCPCVSWHLELFSCTNIKDEMQRQDLCNILPSPEQKTGNEQLTFIKHLFYTRHWIYPLHLLSHLTLTLTPWGQYHDCTNFVSGETEAEIKCYIHGKWRILRSLWPAHWSPLPTSLEQAEASSELNWRSRQTRLRPTGLLRIHSTSPHCECLSVEQRLTGN